jgi:two-component system, cell cycle sensor histidine kinase and response regulator CckA
MDPAQKRTEADEFQEMKATHSLAPQRAEKMESLGALAGGVAHDLNNLLGVVMGYSELMLVRLDKESSLREHVGTIMKASERAAAIVQDMLTLARRGIETQDPLDLNAIVSEQLVSPEYMKLASSHVQVKVRTDLEADLPKIKGSLFHLEKALMNLFTNAMEAIRDIGAVNVRTESRYLETPVSGYEQIDPGDYVLLSVSDNGEGTAPDAMARLFEPFYTKKVMGRNGTGLELSVVWGVVKDHAGYIDVQSRPNHGTTFTLYFPVTREEAAISNRVLPIGYMGKGETILVVDDVQEQRDLATQMLTSLNYSVKTVSDGQAAVKYLMECDVDLMVIDMIMDPGIDGLETYRRISQVRRDQKTILVSGFAETDRVKKAQEIGAGAFVRKPYILENIGRAVRMELDKPISKNLGSR